MAAQIVSRLKMEGNIMAIGERIRFIRNLRGMTQKFLGLQVGFVGTDTPIFVWHSMNRVREHPRLTLWSCLPMHWTYLLRL